MNADNVTRRTAGIHATMLQEEQLAFFFLSHLSSHQLVRPLRAVDTDPGEAGDTVESPFNQSNKQKKEEEKKTQKIKGRGAGERRGEVGMRHGMIGPNLKHRKMFC